jgi:hypothetical protein
MFRSLVLLLALAAGCCSAQPLDVHATRAINLRTPWNTVDVFRYAIRVGDWEAVYDMLSPETQKWVDEEVGRFAFETFFGGLKYRRLDKDAPPEVADMEVAELVHRAEIIAVRADDVDEGLWWVQLYYKPIPPAKTRFPLVNTAKKGETPRWTVGLYEWLH